MRGKKGVEGVEAERRKGMGEEGKEVEGMGEEVEAGRNDKKKIKN